jgi:release factor glutamine methyltransferase
MKTFDSIGLAKWGEKKLKDAGVECAEYDTRELLSFSESAEAFRDYIRKRASRYPLQYLIGETEFMGISLKLAQGVFIPRHETELLAEKALEYITGLAGRRVNPVRKECSNGVNILEVGTGSGNLAISLTKNVTNCKIIASDVSDLAIETAKKNARANGVSERIDFIKSDLFNGIPRRYIDYFDVIISNPPYIKQAEIRCLQPEIAYEDITALDGGDDGLGFYRKILGDGRIYLKAGGIFAFEIGHDQGAAVSEIGKEHSELGGVKIFKDYNGHDRVVIIEKRVAKNG